MFYFGWKRGIRFRVLKLGTSLSVRVKTEKHCLYHKYLMERTLVLLSKIYLLNQEGEIKALKFVPIGWVFYKIFSWIKLPKLIAHKWFLSQFFLHNIANRFFLSSISASTLIYKLLITSERFFILISLLIIVFQKNTP